MNIKMYNYKTGKAIDHEINMPGFVTVPGVGNVTLSQEDGSESRKIFVPFEITYTSIEMTDKDGNTCIMYKPEGIDLILTDKKCKSIGTESLNKIKLVSFKDKLNDRYVIAEVLTLSIKTSMQIFEFSHNTETSLIILLR